MAVAWPWPVVLHFWVLVSLLVLRCFPVAALPPRVLLVVRRRWPVVPVPLAPLALPLVQLVLLLVPREPLAVQVLQEDWMEVLDLPVAAVAGVEPEELVLVAVLVLLVVLPTQHPVPSAVMLRAGIVPLVELLGKPWEPKAQTKVLSQVLPKVRPRALAPRLARSAGIPLADRLHQPVLLAVPHPVPQATRTALPVLTPRPRGPVKPQNRTVELLIPRLQIQQQDPVLPRGHRTRQHPVPGLRTLRPRPRRQRTLPPSR